MNIITWDRIEEERINEGISRKMFWGGNVMVVRWRLGPGVELPTHDHVSEQVTMVSKGSVTLIFPDETREVTLGEGDMLVIPPSKPHGVRVGPEGCLVTDLFSPIREDFISGTSSYLPAAGSPESGESSERPQPPHKAEAYKQLQSYLKKVGVTAELEQLMEVELEILARYTYEKECISMGELRKILGLDKKQAKALLREWKHGDDHSEYSLRRKMERLVMLPGDLHPRPKKS